MIRKRMIFHGHVQGVGFRYISARNARSLGLTGWVQNEPDGTVRMEVQGSPVKIDMLLAALMRDSYIDISSIDAKEISLVDTEKGFGVKGY